MWIYIYQNNSELAMKNAYIGEYRVPWANTIAYYKFDWNLNDSSGNNRNLSLATGSVTYWTESWWAKYGYFNTSTYTNNYTGMPYNSSAYTINIWYKRVGNNSGEHQTVADFHTWWNYFPRLRVFSNEVWYIVSSSNVSTSNTDTWSNYCISISNNTATCYRNWTQVWQFAVNSYNNTLPYFRLNTVWYVSTAAYGNYPADGRMSTLIIENKARTAQEVADYYNLTKSNYWL